MSQQRNRRSDGVGELNDYRHGAARQGNNPPVGIAPTYEAREHWATQYRGPTPAFGNGVGRVILLRCYQQTETEVHHGHQDWTMDF